MDDGARVKRDICATGEERAASPARTRHVDSSPTCSTYNQRPVHLECRPWRSCAVDTRHDFRHEGRKLSSSEGGEGGGGVARASHATGRAFAFDRTASPIDVNGTTDNRARSLPMIDDDRSWIPEGLRGKGAEQLTLKP